MNYTQTVNNQEHQKKENHNTVLEEQYDEINRRRNVEDRERQILPTYCHFSGTNRRCCMEIV